MDKYAKNIHAKGFEHADGNRYELLTAYEMLEHLTNPVEDISAMLQLADNLLVSTLVLPDPAPTPPDWWYYSAGSGQHISLYSRESLLWISKHLGLHLLTNGEYHLFTRTPQSAFRFKLAMSRAAALINWTSRRESLIPSDSQKMSA